LNGKNQFAPNATQHVLWVFVTKHRQSHIQLR